MLVTAKMQWATLELERDNLMCNQRKSFEKVNKYEGKIGAL
jgi:hypothetical protein